MVGIVARLSIGGLETPHVITQFGTSQQSCLRQVIQISKNRGLIDAIGSQGISCVSVG